MLFSSFTARAGLAAALVAGLWAADARVRPAPMPPAQALMPAISVQGHPVEAAQIAACGDGRRAHAARHDGGARQQLAAHACRKSVNAEPVLVFW